MSDFVSGFWNVYVAIITLVSVIGCAVFLWSQSRVKPLAAGTQAELKDHVWDEDLQEYNNPLPGWWRWLFYLTVVFSLAYLAVYPGLGTYRGSFNWSSTGQYDAEMQQASAQYAPIFEQFAGQELKVVAVDPQARQMGERLFVTYCAQCHGSDARGARGFPNLTDNDWLYGGEPETVKASIMEGRQGVMPPFVPALSGEQVKDVANYVRSLSNLANDSLRSQRGKDVFAQNCVACHGPQARGMPAVGAPNLTDGTWLYGSSEASIAETIAKGRSNKMPAHKEFLGEAKVHLLAAYVIGLSARAAPGDGK
jgi:cytochrome c oxidase cbb3-type subunit 3